MTAAQDRARLRARRQAGEPLRMVGEIVFPYYAVHLRSRRVRGTFDEEVRVIEPKRHPRSSRIALRPERGAR